MKEYLILFVRSVVTYFTLVVFEGIQADEQIYIVTKDH